MWYLMSPVLAHTKNANAKTTRQPTAMARSFTASERNIQSRSERLRDGVGAFMNQKCGKTIVPLAP